MVLPSASSNSAAASSPLQALGQQQHTFAESSDPETRRWVAKGLANGCLTLGQMNRIDDMLALAELFVARYWSSTDPFIEEQLARVLANRAGVKGSKGNVDVAIAEIDQLEARFYASDNAEIQAELADATEFRRQLIEWRASAQ